MKDKSMQIALNSEDSNSLNQMNKLKIKIQSSNGFQIKDRNYLYKTYKNCFIGYEAVDWLYSNCPNMSTRDDAIKLGQSLLDNNIIFNVAGNETIFKDDYIFYEFESNRINNSITSSSSKSTTSLSSVSSSPSKQSSSSSSSSSSSKSNTISSSSSSNKNRLSTSIEKLNGRRTSSVPPPVLNGSTNTTTNNGSNSSSGGSSPNTSTTPTSSTTTSYNSNSYNKKHHRYSINDLSKVVLEDLNTVTLVKDELIQLSQELMHGDKGLKLQKKKKGVAGNTILCFSGSQLVDWLVKKLDVTRKESIQIASAIMHLNIFIEVGSVFNTNVMSATLSTTIPSSISLGSISSSSTSVIDLNYSAPIPTIPISVVVNPLSLSSSLSSPLSLSTSSIPAFDNRIVEDSSEVFYEFLTKPEAIINHVAMKKLDDLCLAHKQISIIPTTIINTSKYLKILDLSFNQLSDTNQLETIATLYNLESCNLSHNQLSSIPSSFNRLELLSKLNLSHNCFTTIPTVVYQITSLEEFSIAANQLTTISESIGQLRSLERLDFKNNKLLKIPKEIGLLSRLKTLNVLYNNKISELPPFLSTLPMLEQLEFSIDTVKSPPKEITATGNIKTIIGYLKDLFEGTETLPHIKLMVLGSEKTGKSTLIKALSKSTTKSLSRQSANFLKKVTSPEIYVNESIEITQLKLDLPAGITINNDNGNGSGNGMTHSLSSLSLSTGLLPPPQPTTTSSSSTVTDTKPPRKDSFNSTPEKKRSSSSSIKKNIKLMIYDFKMQSSDVYYHTHQFFLSERAFYLITYDINKDLKHSNIDYWVDSIKKKAPHAPIYIVATHIDTFNQNGGDIMVPLGEVENYLNQRYLEVSGVIGISSTTLRNIDLLKNEIVVTLLNQHQHQQQSSSSLQQSQSKTNLNQTLSTNWLNERIPSIYITLETNLKEEAKKRPIVTWDEYQTIAKLSNFTNTATSYEKLIRATNTLNRWGSIIWFEDSKSSLKDFVILDPQWFSDCFSKLLLAKHQYINSDGILLLINLKNIWKPNIVPEQFHIKLLKLLERYQILYTLKNNSNLLNNQQSSSSSNSSGTPPTPNSAISSPSLSTESSLNSMSYSLESRSISSPLPTVLLSAEISTTPTTTTNTTGNNSPLLTSASLLSSSSTSAFTTTNGNGNMSGGSQPTSIKNSLKNSLRSINGSNSTSFTLSFNRIIIPCLLPVAKPSHLKDLWETWSGDDEHQIGRYYQFKNSPKNYFDRLMVRFLYMMEPIVYYSSGILFRKTPGSSKDSNMSSCGTLVEFDMATQQLQIRVRGHEFEACAKLFQIVLENVDTILKDCQMIDQSLETYIPCSCNSNCRDLPHLFTIDLIEETFGRGESHIRCPVSKKLVCLGTISPDITLSSVSSNKKILKEDLIYQEEVGIGGFAKVFKGIYKNTTVAIKQLNFERMDLIDSTSFNNLNNSINGSMVNSSSNSSLNSLSLSTSNMLPPQQIVNNNKMYIQNNNTNNTTTSTTSSLTSSTSISSNLSQSTNKIQRNLSTSSLSSNSSQEDYNSLGLTGGSSSKLNAINEFRREVWLMSGLSHSNIVLMKGFCFEPYSIVMEYMDLGSLSSFLKNKKESGLTSLPWKTLMKIAIDIASGMQFLHNITPPLVHRDLKSPNILLASNSVNDNDDDIIAKVSDFGLSMGVVQNFTSSTRLVDNPKWLSPEVLKKMEYNEKSDIYSFAMIMWELYHLELPFDEFDFKFMSLLEDNIISGLRPSISKNCNQQYSNLITRCWNNDPNLRPSFNTILSTLKSIEASTLSNNNNNNNNNVE